MFQSITWGTYLHYLFIIIPVYYAVVLSLYFRQEVVGLFTKRKLRRKLEGDGDLLDAP
ncbi:hypothetical protein SAMN05192529_10946 [Arachidicoccus rhizosphaerae]|uniref:Uncharacterized protein n=1 Tax=Arachidicoccus rhizosphaerae TaxID=551991 RepID=A0A1H3YV30_9BACT|nr:hypothetical protein [Arachidicoccus rhizosphaerae]SEA14894.1 hypothetical protein SAMN05192529_10946 [Arachidicoccus rhizosphaerae]